MGAPALWDWRQLENTCIKEALKCDCVGDSWGLEQEGKSEFLLLGSVPRQHISEPGLSKLMGGRGPADNQQHIHVLKAH